MGMLSFDVRQALRALARVPGTALLCAVTLAVGIAAASTTFSAVYAALFRPIPFADPERLLVLNQVRTDSRAGTVLLRWSYTSSGQLLRTARSFAAAGTYSRTSVGISGQGDSEQVDGEMISSGYLSALAVSPAIGRAFTSNDDSNATPVVLISDGLWRRRFGADQAAIGGVLHVNGVPLTIAGIMPPGFAGVSGRAMLWIPSTLAPRLTYREYVTTPQHFINLVARLRPDTTLAQANAELAALAPQLSHSADDAGAAPTRWSAAARPLSDARVDPAQRRSLLLILAGSGCLLLVTCVNVALLLLTRARTRRGETAIRIALGASRARLVKEMMTESALIAAAGGLLGVLIAAWGIAWLRAAAPGMMPSPQNGYGQIAAFAEPAMDRAILLFVATLTAVVTVTVGAVPAFVASRSDPAVALAGSSRALAGRGGGRVMHVLVAVQIAVAVLLVSGSTLLVRTMLTMEAGRRFVNQQAISFWVNAPGSRYPDETGPAVVERVLARIRQVPGVTEAAVNRCTPFGASCARALLFLPGRSTQPADAPLVERHYVSGSYFAATGIALRRGRLLDDDHDRAGRPAVVVINETAARRFWPGQDPIGQHLWFSQNPGFTDPSRPVEVVGVVADVTYWPANEPVAPDFYTSYLQFTYPSSMYIVNAEGVEVLPAIRRAVAEIDPVMTISEVRRIDERVAEAVGGTRFTASATAIFAGAAALLAALGVFGVTAFSVSARRDEMALRLALGATPAGLQAAVLWQVGRLALAGAVTGIALSAWLLQTVSRMFYGVSPADPPTLIAATLTMIVLAVGAAALPAWRVSGISPLGAMRAP